MSDPFIGEIKCFGFNFAPRGYALCNGQLLPIAQFTALFSILGTTYGGNGQTNFALPDLRGRAPMQPGQAAGLSFHVLGELAGTETVQLIATEMPAHNHSLAATTALGNTANPADALPARGNFSSQGRSGAVALYADGGPDTSAATNALGITGGSQPHSNMMPYLAMNFCIAVEGIFPSRN